MKRLSVKIISIIMAVILMSSSLTAFAADNKFGVDVSYHNESVDYVQQAKDGKSFAMIRLGYYNHLDTAFWKHVEDVCAADMDFGVYLYSYAYSLDEAQIEADFVLDTLARMPDEYKEHFVLPVAYDLEDSSMTKYGKTQITNQAMLFCQTMEKAGYVPMVYANVTWFKNYIDISQIYNKGYKIWLANPVSNPSFTSKKEVGTTGIYADMWQYAFGDTDAGTLDQNVLYDLNSLKHIYKTTTTKATTNKNGSVVTKCSVCGAVKTKSTIYYPKTITLSSTSYTYNGKAKKPSVTVKDSKGKKISASNYTVSYSSGRKNVGKYTVTIKFKGNYSGTVKKTFTIKPKNTTISKVTAGKKKFTVKWKKYTTQTTGYQIQYSTDKNFKKNNKTVTVSKNKTTSKTISKLSAKKKYYVRIRTYKTVSGTKYYSSWSKAKTVTTKK
ncbi:MAG: GH25 family lysozyme [Eubacterium sp.]